MFQDVAYLLISIYHKTGGLHACLERCLTVEFSKFVGIAMAAFDFLRQLFSTDFMPRGHCYWWNGNLMWLHAVADFLIGLSYGVAAALLFFLFRKRRTDGMSQAVFVSLTIFLLWCGGVHLLNVVTLWVPVHRLDGAFKAVTAALSVYTAFALFPIFAPIINKTRTKKEVKDRSQQLLTGHEKTISSSNDAVEAECYSQLLAEYTPQLVWICDIDGQICWSNRKWFEYAGLTSLQVRECGWLNLVHPDYIEKVSEHFKAHLISGESWEEVFPMRGKSGEFRWFLIRAHKAIDNRSGNIYWLGTHTDFHEQKLQSEKLKRLNAELSRFTFVASHDLREPLRVAAIYTQVLAKELSGKLDPATIKYMSYIINNVERMDTLVSGLVNYSQAGTIQGSIERLCLNQLVSDVLAKIKEEMKEIRATVDVGILPTVLASREQLFQVFQELLRNAFKYRKLTEPPVISIDGLRKKESWIVMVRDNGVGIDCKYFDRIFQLFYQLDKKEENSGVGVGLPICKKIIENHNGHLWIESEVGCGSTFYFTLPA